MAVGGMLGMFGSGSVAEEFGGVGGVSIGGIGGGGGADDGDVEAEATEPTGGPVFDKGVKALTIGEVALTGWRRGWRRWRGFC